MKSKIINFIWSLFPAAKVLLVLVICFFIARGLMWCYDTASRFALDMVTDFVDKQVEQYEVVLDDKKGTVSNLAELDEKTLARKLFTTSVQYHNCIAEMDNIHASSGIYSGRTR